MVLETIEFFLENEKYELIVRVCPAELRGTVPSNQKWWMKSTNNLKNSKI